MVDDRRMALELLELCHDFAWSVDADGRITYANDAARAVLGWTPAELVGRSFAEVLVGDGAGAPHEPGDAVDIARSFRRKNGSICALVVTTRVLRDGAGSVIGSIGVARGSTAQLEVERAWLAEAQALAKVGSWSLDLVTNTLTWSEETYRIFEIDATGPASYEEFLELVHPEDRERVNRAYSDSVTSRVPYAIDHRIRFPDGREKIVHERCQTFYDAVGRPVRSIGTTQDVTSRRLAEAALFDSRQALRGILDSVPQRVFWKDRNSVYLGCNRAFARDMGFGDPDEVVGKSDDDATWKASSDAYRNDDRDVMTSGQAKLNYEEEMVFADGRRGWLRTSKVPIRGLDGSVSGVIGTYEDITERKQLEQQLHHAQRLESIGTLAAGMAHEINNPLTYVSGNIEVCRDWLKQAMTQLRRHVEAPTNPLACERVLERLAQLEEPLDDAIHGAARVRQLVLDIKKMVRPQEAPHGCADLHAAVATAVKQTSNSVRHAARVHTKLEPTPLVQVSESPLVQVVTNLLLNAADAIGAGNAEANAITITCSMDPAGWACLEVRDTGPGIAPDVLPRIFDPFFTTKRVGAGMGLGLSTAHNIVSGAGGRLSAESLPAGGAVLRVSLPPATAPQAARVEDVRSPAPDVRRSVLVIDDEKAVAVAIERMLRDRHDVTVVTNGRDGLERIAAGRVFDVIFCDVMMPNLSGIDVYRLMAGSHAEQAKRIVFMTGGAFTAASQDFLDEIGSTRIAKPFTAEVIRSIVASADALR